MARTMVAGVLAVASTAMLSPVSATYPGDDGSIVFFRYSEGLERQEYRTIQPDGSGNAPFDLTTRAIDPAWSPDGSRIAYATFTRHGPAVEIFEPALSTVTHVLVPGDLPGVSVVSDLAFDPTGTRLVFCAKPRRDPDSRLYTIDTDASDLTEISGNRDLCDPDWSSTDRIAASAGNSRRTIVTLAPDGSDVEAVARLDRARRTFDVEPLLSWAPDGSAIAIRALGGRRRTDIWIVDSDGSDLHRFTDTPRRWEWAAEWSPDGSALVVARGGRGFDDFADLFVMSLGGGRTRLTDTERWDEFVGVAWQPIV
jgi:Tol biopolymer transport system component